jgi:hypothetical protein
MSNSVNFEGLGTNFLKRQVLMGLAGALLAYQIVNNSVNTARFETKLCALEPYRRVEQDGINYLVKKHVLCA